MADGGTGSRILAFALLAGACVISYQGWQNAKLSVATQNLAKDHACDQDSSCIVLDDSPRVGRADVIRHRYEFNTTHGMKTVTCQRELYFFGAWSCSPQDGRLVTDPIP